MCVCAFTGRVWRISRYIYIYIYMYVYINNISVQSIHTHIHECAHLCMCAQDMVFCAYAFMQVGACVLQCCVQTTSSSTKLHLPASCPDTVLCVCVCKQEQVRIWYRLQGSCASWADTSSAATAFAGACRGRLDSGVLVWLVPWMAPC